MRYLSLNEYTRREFGKKLYKLSLQSGCSCPNRDGTLGKGGCIFCSAGGSGEFAASEKKTIKEQLREAKGRIRSKLPAGELGYIAYFQSYTNTYGPAAYFRPLWEAAIEDPEVEVLSIATRPDCLEPDILSLLSEMNEKKPVWVELGLQTIHEKTAQYLRRGYALSCFEEAVRKLTRRKIPVIVHVILGLPGESREQMLQTVDYVGRCGAMGIKLQLLHVLEGTDLAEEYRAGRVPIMEREEYFSLLGDCLSILPKDMVIHRLTGDGPKRLLLAPLWTGNKKQVLNSLQAYLDRMDICQGSCFGKERL